MTALVFPRASQQLVVDGDGSPVGYAERSWFMFLRQLWSSLGWSRSEPIYGDDWIPGSSMAHVIGVEGYSNLAGSLWARRLRNGADDGLAGSVLLPNNLTSQGTAVPVSVIWCPTDANAGNVSLRLSYGVGSIGSAIAQDSAETITVAVPGVANALVRTSFTAISGGAKDSPVVLTIERLGASDSYGSPIGLIGLSLKPIVEGIGSEKANP